MTRDKDDHGSVATSAVPAHSGMEEMVTTSAASTGLGSRYESSNARWPNYVSPGRSAMHHLRMVSVITLVCAMLGIGYGLVRPPVYSAEARLYVGKTLSLTNTAAIAGLATASYNIASDYARLVSTSSVIGGAEKRLGHPGRLGGTLTASPVPDSPILRVDATGPSAASAVDLANAGAGALVATVDKINQLARTQVNQLQLSYANDENTVVSLTSARSKLLSEIGALSGHGGNQAKINALQAQVNKDSTAIQVAQLKAQADSAQYQSQVSSLTSEEKVISQVGRATVTASNRTKNLEIGLIAGLVGGLILAVAVASYRDIRADRRQQAGPGAGLTGA